MSIKSKIKQYGFKTSILRSLKGFFRILGISYESFLLVENDLTNSLLVGKMKEYDYSNVKELTYDDFKLGDSSVFTPSKMEIIKSRFEDGNYWAYGIVEKQLLTYSCWITTLHINFPDRYKTNYKLGTDEGFLEDAYCHPKFRGKGYHSKMVLFRSNRLHNFKKNKSLVLILKDNIPALKAQLKSGASIKKQFTFISFFGRKYFYEKSFK